jgi:hypothetical protein
MSLHEVSPDGIPFAVEDQFIVFSFGTARNLCPTSDNAENLGALLKRLDSPLDCLTPVYDLRGLQGYYNDIDDFIRLTSGEGSHVIIGSEQREAGFQYEIQRNGLPFSVAKGPCLPTSNLDVGCFEFKASKYEEVRYAAILSHGAENADNVVRQAQGRDLEERIMSFHRNSLFTQIVLQSIDNRIRVIPYRANALHNIEGSSGKILLGRPGAIAAKTGAIFREEIEAFERLINGGARDEHDLQKFLERSPNFLGGLGYKNIYPQVVLHREEAEDLKPDFILEPCDTEYCDILELKLPTDQVIVGKPNRKRLAAVVTSAVAQLREYAAYFDEKKHRDFVFRKYGLQAYKPRLTLIIGRDVADLDDLEIRRSMTAYEGLEIMTYDGLLAHAKQRVLL